MRKTLFTASALALALAAPFAQAFEAGDIIVRAGAVTVDPREDSGNIKAGGAALPGTGATLNSDTQLGLNFAYMVTDKVGIELLAATPFSHDVGTKGLGGLKLGEVKHLPPTLSVVYYPLEKTSAFQPYVGAGINYTWFFDDKLTSEAENSALQLRGLDMKDSWGLAAQVGMDYMLTDNIMLNAQVRYIDIDTTGTTYSGDTKIKVDVDVDPFVYMVGLGYKF
ncbi:MULTISPECIES: OmpW/AlkL family protein [Stutzerimonas]|jgi:outer membrane protein|uniref:Outer membrane beta-barrel protein n=1 Tax=Stutzerimonas stutzeri TaxID=316 RepID=A0AA42P981_STUST|nr:MULTISPECIES: OmpW family outer membrane protein [Stutzerimonas]EPL63418.1 outer membrane protein OprG [Stutzerimonas stutzeri B1SMN1]OHC23188.1 MAG: outer membrane protein OmpW [Pseudomonadales bacterium RIFCSPHIGHO2_01_FULL_64_12]MBD9410752.1 outer membrane beta-barrel protein [Stutzerimonas stutzeri]MBH3354955.1 outer membrane beta-barrel protein [Stutzerimonas stutzeri]MBK3804552.1 outer membrane beta-barrel protein [Stutzerimonas stutzeri]